MTRSRMLRTLSTIGATVLAMAGLTACVGTPGGIQAPDSWTILTYMVSDNDLEPFMMEDVEEMGAVGSRPGLNIVSLVDRSPGYSDEPVLGIPAWEGAKLLQIEPGTATELYDYGSVNLADPATLAAFIREGIRAFPASNYALFINDHGAGWPGIGVDETSERDILTLDELDQALTQGLAEAGVDKIDLLGFDACLMATYEVATTLAPHARRMLASQETEPGHGWDYTVLDAAYRGADVDELGGAIIDGFRDVAFASGTQEGITLSLVDLENFGVVDEAVAAFASALTERVADVGPAVGRTLAQTLGFGVNPDPRRDYHLKDLGILAGEIGVEALDVADEADAVVRAVNDVVLDKVDGQSTRGATGISIYFPPVGERYDERYTAVAEQTGWSAFLDAYYTAGSQIAPDDIPVFVGQDATIEFADGGVVIGGAFEGLTAENVSEVFYTYGILNADGSVTYLGDGPGQLTDDGSAVAFYNLGNLVLDDGEDSQPAYLSLVENATAGTVSVQVPVLYHPASDGESVEALLTLGLDPATGTVISEAYYAYDPLTGNYGELPVEPTGLIQGIFPTYDAATNEYTWDVDPAFASAGLYADLAALDYAIAPVPSGTRMVVELWVTDFGGNQDYVSAVITVP